MENLKGKYYCMSVVFNLLKLAAYHLVKKVWLQTKVLNMAIMLKIVLLLHGF